MEGRHRTGQGQCTSDSMKEGEGQRAAYSYQLFKHIPPHTETLQSEDKKKKEKQKKKTHPLRGLKVVNQPWENTKIV